MDKATEKDFLELLEVTADAAEDRGYVLFSNFLRDMAASPSTKIPPVEELLAQLEEHLVQLEKLLGLTEPFVDELPQPDRDEWLGISTWVADQRDDGDEDDD